MFRVSFVNPRSVGWSRPIGLPPPKRYLCSQQHKGGQEERKHKQDQRRQEEQEQQVPRSGYSGLPLLLLPCVTFLLGTWQVWRWRKKEELLARLAEAKLLPALELAEALEAAKAGQWELLQGRTIHASGQLQLEQQVLLGPRFEEGEAGYHVITPLVTSSGPVLVNRGWVPRSFSGQEEPKGLKAQVHMNGVAKRGVDSKPPFVADNDPSNGKWFWLDLPAIAHSVGTQPFLLEAHEELSPHQIPKPVQPREIPNDHLSYIFTWYTLTGALGAMAFLFIRRGGR